MNNQEIKDKLKQITYPGFNRDIVSFGMLKDIIVSNNDVKIFLSINTKDQESIKIIKKNIIDLLNKYFNNVIIDVSSKNNSVSEGNKINIANIVAIASGKGGVGKSTVAINLAATLSNKYNVGLLDLDIYGPSLPMIIGDTIQPKVTEEGKIYPIEKYNMKLMSFGFISGNKSPAIWRGPMVARMTNQFFDDVLWGDLDFLILDLPPGTGDIQLTLVQKIALTGAIIVTTPQDLAVLDVSKGADMFNKVNTKVLGIIENMSDFQCPHCNEITNIFKGLGGKKESERLNVPMIGSIPIFPDLAESTDIGTPYVILFFNFAWSYPLFLWFTPQKYIGQEFYHFNLGLSVIIGFFAIFINLFKSNKIFMDFFSHSSIYYFFIWFILSLVIIKFFWKKNYPIKLISILSIYGLLITYNLSCVLINLNINIFGYLIGALILSCIVFTMILGHWYLNVPDLPIIYLRRIVIVFGLLLILRFIWNFWSIFNTYAIIKNDILITNIILSDFIFSFEGIFIWIAILFGLLGAIIINILTYLTVKMHSTQSATGLLYVNLIMILMSEIIYKYYLIYCGIAL